MNKFMVRLIASAAIVIAAPAHALVLGVTEGVTYRATDNQIEAKFVAIAEALSKALKQPVTIKVVSAYNDLRGALAQGEVDLVFIHPAHVAFEATKTGRYQSIAWTSGFTEYKVSFLCKDSQPISNWSSLTGKKLVTPDPDSITAVMTRAMLRQNGVEVGGVKVLTTRYQDAVPFYVEHGFAVYGATAARSVIKAWKDTGGKTCAESPPVPIKQWLASSRLDPAIAATARDTLIGLSQSEAGRRALATSGYAGFVAPSADLEKELTAWLGV
jgi:ABC-type phosphate/phosphonate transport system substrate-binding protein